MSEIDDKINRKLALDAFFGGQGWQMFIERLNELKDFSDCSLDKLSSGVVQDENLQEFNFHLGEKRAFQAVLRIKEELYEEFEETNSPSEEA